MWNPSVQGVWLGRLVIAAAIAWHLLTVLAPPRSPPPQNTEGRDFASYHYAAKVASQGGDPYDKGALESLAAGEGTRSEVHPFFYPPPFLWLVAWAPAFSLRTGFGIWFVLNELALLAACLALISWWRSFGRAVAPILGVTVALMYGVAYSAELGQANFPVLLLVLLGAWQDTKRPVLAGVLVGLACMMKMSPAVFVIWWIARRRWSAVGAAIATAVLSSVLTLPLLSLFGQLNFYTDVLPQFGSGDYNGLDIKIEMFGNHSVPNLWHLYFPSGENRLSAAARLLSAVSALAIVGGLLAAFRGRTEDPVQLAGQVCALLVAMTVLPVYAYEHHLVFAIPAMVLAAVALLRGWLSSGWTVPLGIAIPVLAYDLPSIRQFALRVVTSEMPGAFFWVQELKFLALLVVALAMVRLGATAFPDLSRPPPPRPVED